jgi:non-ribosomal peptide synthetase component E (peptide arylation enzyme)
LPHELEYHLTSASAAVIGKLDQWLGEEVVAVVVRRA